MTDRPPPRGRGAALLEALNRRKAEAKTVGLQEETPTADVQEEAPKPKGRAALLRHLQEAKLKRVGTETSAVTTSASQSASVTTESRPASRQVTEKELEDVSKSVSELGFVDRDAVYYRGRCLVVNCIQKRCYMLLVMKFSHHSDF